MNLQNNYPYTVGQQQQQNQPPSLQFQQQQYLPQTDQYLQTQVPQFSNNNGNTRLYAYGKYDQKSDGPFIGNNTGAQFPPNQYVANQYRANQFTNPQQHSNQFRQPQQPTINQFQPTTHYNQYTPNNTQSLQQQQPSQFGTSKQNINSEPGYFDGQGRFYPYTDNNVKCKFCSGTQSATASKCTYCGNSTR